MPLGVIDALLDRIFREEPCCRRLDRLEFDVWTRIRHSHPGDKAAPVKRLRFASIFLAVVGTLAISQISFQPTTQGDALGLDVFSPRAPLLVTSIYTELSPFPS